MHNYLVGLDIFFLRLLCKMLFNWTGVQLLKGYFDYGVFMTRIIKIYLILSYIYITEILLNTAHLTQLFDNTISIQFFSTCQHKYKFSRFLVYVQTTNINNHLIFFKKTNNTYLKAKNSQHTTRISNFTYVFIIFFEKSDAKIYICIAKNYIQDYLTYLFVCSMQNHQNQLGFYNMLTLKIYIL